MKPIRWTAAASAVALAVPLAHAAATVPAALALPAGEQLLLAVAASGVQIYRCEVAKADPKKLQWSLVAPEADLYDTGGKKIGHHYAGPTWELDDGSKLAGEVLARDPGPDAGAVPWLLLKAKDASGKGRIGTARFVRRIDTSGGKPAAPDCAQAGTESRVAYKATYEFYGAAGGY